MSALRTALTYYAAKQISTEQIVRLMIESREWFVPATFAARKLNRKTLDHGIACPRQGRRLVLFTDRKAAVSADQYPIGSFVGAFSGAAIFEALDAAEFDRVDVNPGSPVEETWFIDSEAFEIVKQMSRSMRQVPGAVLQSAAATGSPASPRR